MKKLRPFLSLLLCLNLLLISSVSHSSEAATGKKVMVATAHPFATATALEVLKSGGNAVDAAIAAQWVLNVAEPQSSGIGGGGFFLYYEAATGRIYSLDGRETAPSRATPDMFLDASGNPITFYPMRVTGGLPVGVPGLLRLLKRAHERFASGVFSFSDLFEPAIELAANGFHISPRLARFIENEKERLRLFEDSARIFLDDKGKPLKENAILIQTDLAKTFRQIQREGVLVFYEGPIARAIVNSVQHAPFNPGRMTLEDLMYYNIVERKVMHSTYRGYDIFGMGPPSSGGITVAETLNILEYFDVSNLDPNDSAFLFLEAQKLAFQDRNRYAGDSDFANIPIKKLISKAHAREKANQINFTAAAPVAGGIREEGDQTSHLSIVDAQGNMVSFTTTIEHVFGSAMIVPGWGFFLNNELTDFDAEPRDETGKLKANAPEPRKRPRSSMSPTFVFKEGKPFLIVGSPGGSTIIGTVLNILVNVIDQSMTPEEALAAAKMINRDGPSELEPGLFDKPDLKKLLQTKGHKIKLIEPFGNAQIVFFDAENEQLFGVSDPRGEGSASGY